MMHIILCRPEGSVNIGSVCRAMRAMNLRSLILVGTNRIDEDEVRKWSLGAYGIYESAAYFPDLAEAVSSMAWVVGVSRRRGKNRKRYALTPEDFAASLSNYAGNPVALVFGNEKNGLNDSELRLCHGLLTIPADDENGSLNLSHAVQICAYAVFRASTAMTEPTRTFSAATQEDVKQLVVSVTERMDQAGIFRSDKKSVKKLTCSRLYDILGTIPLRKVDIKFLRHTFDKLIHAPKHTEKMFNDLPKEGE